MDYSINTVNSGHSELVSNTFKHIDGRGGVEELKHACFGIMGEVGELVDAVKKHVYYGKELDLANVIEELGDIEYYLEALSQNLGLSRENILTKNLDKLNKRYPNEVFTNEAAIARADKEDTIIFDDIDKTTAGVSVINSNLIHTNNAAIETAIFDDFNKSNAESK